MNFKYIFKKSYNEYKNNFKVIFLLSLVFIGIPIIIGSFLLFGFIVKNPDFYNNFVDNNLDLIPIKFLLIIFLIGLMSIIFYFILESGLVKDSINGKFNFYKTSKNGFNNFWKFVWFSIVSLFFLLLLFLAFIIPGIIFAVYWSIAIFVYFDSKKTVMESLRISFYMVKGNWWKIFGYSLLMLLLYIIIGLIFSLISFPIELAIYSLENPSIKLLTFNLILNSISNFLYNLIIIPFSILFYKNIYLELKKKKQ